MLNYVKYADFFFSFLTDRVWKELTGRNFYVFSDCSILKNSKLELNNKQYVFNMK